MFLQSERLQLRAPELGDLDFMFHVENDTRLWVVSACKVPFSRYLLQQYIETNSHDIYVDKQLRLMMEHRESRELVGIIDVFDYNPADHRAEVGVVVDGAFRHLGYAREALMLLCDYVSSVLGMHQLYAYIDVTNEPSRHLFKQCGFEECALLKDWMRMGKSYRDVVMVQLLNR